MPDRRQRENVELARVGTFPLSTGEHTFTAAQLASAVRNAQTTVQPARLGIGHVDPRFNSPSEDGDPAFGKVVNLRLIENGNAIVGDYDDVIPWLDENLDTLYPGRSIEARVNGDEMEITAVKLLGTTKPGITTLKDLEQLVAASVAAGETTDEQATVAIRTLWAAAGTNVDDLRDAFYGAHPTDPSNDADWWGVQEVQINPNQLIVEHHVSGQETTFRVPWSVDADGTFTFGDLVEVTVEYRDVAASSAASRVIHRAPASRPNQKEGSNTMDAKKLREGLGLAEDASDEDVTTKLAELNARPTGEQVSEQVEQAVAAKAAELAASTGDDDVVKLDPAAYEELKASAAKGKEAHDRLEKNDRETFIAAAVEAGKFPPSRVEHYTSLMEKDPEGTRTFIDGLDADAIPVSERGIAASSETPTELTTTGWFHQLTTKEA
jgi:hypothetical protein